MENTKLYAFWKYHTGDFHTFLHGEVTKVHESGSVSVKGYDGYCFVPFVLLPYEKGLEIGKTINKANSELQDEIKKVKKQGEDRIKALFDGTVAQFGPLDSDQAADISCPKSKYKGKRTK